MTVTPDSGTAPAPSTVNVEIDSSSLTIGVYTGTITISSSNALNSPVLIDIQLNVVTQTMSIDEISALEGSYNKNSTFSFIFRANRYYLKRDLGD